MFPDTAAACAAAAACAVAACWFICRWHWRKSNTWVEQRKGKGFQGLARPWRVAGSPLLPLPSEANHSIMMISLPKFRLPKEVYIMQGPSPYSPSTTAGYVGLREVAQGAPLLKALVELPAT